MADLRTNYMGLELKNPIIVGSSGLTNSVENIVEIEKNGGSAVVLKSLFEEQITQESHALNHYLTQGVESHPEALNYFPEASEYKTGPDEYLEHIQRAKKALDIPVIASLNGVSTGGWVKYAKQIEEAGGKVSLK